MIFIDLKIKYSEERTGKNFTPCFSTRAKLEGIITHCFYK